MKQIIRIFSSMATILLVISSCVDSVPEKYEQGKCYEGKLIRAFCPGIAVVAVTNSNIGVDWTWNGSTYKHAITITNFQLNDSLSQNAIIYFTIDINAINQGTKCTVDIPCQQWAYDQSSPDELVCVKSISTKSCNEP